MPKDRLITPADLTPEYLKKRAQLLEEAILNVEKISTSQESQLQKIAKELLYDKNVLPCKVELVSGEIINNAILVEVHHHIKNGGVILPNHNFPNEILISSIKNISCSENLLPKFISDKISNLNETGMGYTVFYFVFENGRSKQAVCGGQTYFFDFNGEYKIEHVIDIEPFCRESDKRDKQPINSSSYNFAYYAANEY